jgi:hypothetical protein
MKRTLVIVLVLLLGSLVMPIAVGAQAPVSNSHDTTTECYPIGSGTSFEVCVTLNPVSDCGGWYLGPVPPLNYPIDLSDNIYPYGHSIGIRYWGPTWLSGSWIDDRVQETHLWQNVVDVWIGDLGVTASIPVSVLILEPATCGPKVAVCHRDMGDAGFKRIEVSRNALPAHLAHGDYLPTSELGCSSQ